MLFIVPNYSQWNSYSTALPMRKYFSDCMSQSAIYKIFHRSIEAKKSFPGIFLDYKLKICRKTFRFGQLVVSFCSTEHAHINLVYIVTSEKLEAKNIAKKPQQLYNIGCWDSEWQALIFSRSFSPLISRAVSLYIIANITRVMRGILKSELAN